MKEAVFPFNRFPGCGDHARARRMRSTGEVMGLDDDLGIAFAKSQMAAKPGLPLSGKVFFSVKDSDKPHAIELAREFVAPRLHPLLHQRQVSRLLPECPRH